MSKVPMTNNSGEYRILYCKYFLLKNIGDTIPLSFVSSVAVNMLYIILILDISCDIVFIFITGIWMFCVILKLVQYDLLRIYFHLFNWIWMGPFHLGTFFPHLRKCSYIISFLNFFLFFFFSS